MTETKQEWSSKTPTQDGCYFVLCKHATHGYGLFPVIIDTTIAGRRVTGRATRYDINLDLDDFTKKFKDCVWFRVPTPPTPGGADADAMNERLNPDSPYHFNDAQVVSQVAEQNSTVTEVERPYDTVMRLLKAEMLVTLQNTDNDGLGAAKVERLIGALRAVYDTNAYVPNGWITNLKTKKED